MPTKKLEEFWEIEFPQDDITGGRGVGNDLAADLLKRRWIVLVYEGPTRNNYNQQVYVHAYRPADHEEDRVWQVAMDEYNPSAWDPCPICDASGPDESCVEDGKLIDDHAERGGA